MAGSDVGEVKRMVHGLRQHGGGANRNGRPEASNLFRSPSLNNRWGRRDCAVKSAIALSFAVCVVPCAQADEPGMTNYIWAAFGTNRSAAPIATPSPESCHVKAIGDASLSPTDDRCIHWAIGLRYTVDDLGRSGTSSKLRPTIGLKYKRWTFGVSDPTAWIGFAGIRREPTVSYSALQRDNASIRVALRLHNIETGEAPDVLDSGRYTLRGRVLMTLALSEHWTLGGEITHDLLNRGDGQTASVGVSRRIPVSPRVVFSASSALIWGTGPHWRSAYAATGSPALTLGSGVGELGIAGSFRFRMTDQWAFYTTAAADRPLGEAATVGGSRFTYSGQVGFVRFGSF